jgi:ribonuclease P protein component
VEKGASASLFKKQQEQETCRASMSLPRSTSLSDPQAIRKILAQKPKTSKYIAAHHLIDDGSGFALTVPKKLAKRAIDRNRIKRLMREIYRTSPRSPEPQLLVLRLRKKIGDKTKNRLREQERKEIRSELIGLALQK